MAIKHHNAGKLNSHLFFFRGICKYLEPKYTILLDIGTRPVSGAITKLLSNMELNPSVGGICGSIMVDAKTKKCNFY